MATVGAFPARNQPQLAIVQHLLENFPAGE
jgi:hypothetical protein